MTDAKESMAKRISFRRVRKDDLEMICRWWNDSSVMKYLGVVGYHPTLKELRENYWPLWSHPGPGDFQMFILCLDEKAVGEIGYRLTDAENGVADFNIKNFRKDLWGRGIGTAAMRKFLRFIFARRGVKKITAGIREENLPGLSLYRRMGFRETAKYSFEGTEAVEGGIAVQMELSAKEFFGE